MSHDLKLGEVITTPQQRDAIHIAVTPVIAGEDYLSPGTRVRFANNSTERVVQARNESKAIGIIDPFLTTYPEQGQQVWMFLLPNTITSLRHDWTHPAFEVKPPVVSSPQDEARLWIAGFADEMEMGVDEILAAANSYLNGGDGVCLNFDTPSIAYDKAQIFWYNYQILTGETVPKDKREDAFFSCSC